MIFETPDFTEGKRVLNMYYSAIPLSSRPWASFMECLEYFTTDWDLKAKYPSEVSRWKYNDFIETLGRNARILNNPEKLRTAISRVANATSKTKIPSNWSFGQSLVNVAQSFTFTDLKSATKDGLKDFGKVAVSVAAVGIGTYLAWISLAALAVYFVRKKFK